MRSRCITRIQAHSYCSIPTWAFIASKSRPERSGLSWRWLKKGTTPQKRDRRRFTPAAIATYSAIRDGGATRRLPGHPVLRESWATWKQSAESAPEAAALAGSNFAAERQEFRANLLAVANSALLQARTAYTAYKANQTPGTERAYVDANNLAVDACTRAGMTVDDGKRTWNQYAGTTIILK